MTAFATANGARIVTLSLSLPLYGTWEADVTLADPAPLTAPVALTLGNLSLVGAVYRQGPFGGVQYARLVGGGGGWRSTLPAQAYGNPGGVLLSTVLRDAAAAVGEQVNVPSTVDAVIGQFFTREKAPASRVLGQLGGPLWWVDAAGVTQITARPAATITTPFTVEAFDPGCGELTIATEDYASWLPNATFSAPVLAGPQLVSYVRHAAGNDGRLRTHVLVSP